MIACWISLSTSSRRWKITPNTLDNCPRPASTRTPRQERTLWSNPLLRPDAPEAVVPVMYRRVFNIGFRVVCE